MKLKKAERKQAKLRIWLSAPSWAGKTYSALLLAFWITWDWEKIALIDTENWSWELYSDLWEYNVLPLEAPYTPERYIEAIETCENAGIEVIIIDSISHEWEWKGWVLEINENLAQAKFKWNTWAAWSSTTPRHQAFIEKITTSKSHIITTVRNKVETIQDWWKIKKVWVKEQTREWFEYELTINFTIDRDWHLAIASKDRTWLFIDKDPFVITPEVGKQILEWNLSGKKVKTQEENYLECLGQIETCWSSTDIDLVSFDLKQKISENPKFINKEQLNDLGEKIKNKKEMIFKEEIWE